jgi:hypothetical protein
MVGTRFEKLYKHRPERYDDIHVVKWDLNWDQGIARAYYEPGRSRDRHYRRAARRLLNAVHAINRRPLRNNLAQFDGLM